MKSLYLSFYYNRCLPFQINRLINELSKRLDALEVSHNGHHLSFLSPERYQIDVLVVPVMEFDSAKGFYSNGDFSYCLDKMIYKFNLKWSSKGLSYRMTRPEGEVHNLSNADLDLTLTTNTREAFLFLGFGEPNVDRLLDDNKALTQDELINILEECRFYQ